LFKREVSRPVTPTVPSTSGSSTSLTGMARSPGRGAEGAERDLAARPRMGSLSGYVDG
jgi:hypothetical protein